MKPSILLRLIVSLVIVVAFVLGATVAEASNSLNPTALWWAQRQLPLLWIVDGFALVALLPVFGSAILQTRLARRTEELATMRDQHETQMEDMTRHTEETEHINSQQAKSLEALEATVAALSARLAAMDTENKAHQGRMEAEARRIAREAFAALAEEVHTNTRQMDAVSLAMQYQRAEIKQLRQNVRAAQHSYEISELARLTPYERAALEGEAPPLLLEGKEEDKEKGRGGEEEKIQDTRYKIQEEDSSLIPHPSSLSLTPNTQPPTPSAGFFEPTMNAQTTFVTPPTEYEIAYPALEIMADTDLSPADLHLEPTPANVRGFAPPTGVVTPEEYHFLHSPMESEPAHDSNSNSDVDPPFESGQTEAAQDETPESEPQQTEPPRGLRRWFMRL